MPSHSTQFAAITLVAAIVNGAFGYGFSSTTVPLALLYTTSRVLNPALVLVELLLNAHVLFVNRAALPVVGRRMTPVVAGLVPGIAAGAVVVALVQPDWLKLSTFALLLPLILVQGVGARRPIRAERRWSVPFGTGIGALYALTTISGPPLALFLNNQGLARREFRASLGFIRVAEAAFTAAAYWHLGLFTRDALALLPAMVPSLLVGVPLGAWIIGRVEAETFRRICMSFDAWVVGFGISTLLRGLRIVDGPEAYWVVASVAAVDAVLLGRFFASQRRPSAALARPLPHGEA
jgi:uncharacterized membrane protein YfcA